MMHSSCQLRECAEDDLRKRRTMLTWSTLLIICHCYSDPSVFEGLNVPEDILEETKANIARRLTPQPVKIRADIEVACFGYAGIDAIKRALKAGEAVGTESIPIKIKLVAPPLFVMISNATDKNGAIETMERAIAVIDKTISKDKGSLVVKLRVRPRNQPSGRCGYRQKADYLSPCRSPKPYQRQMTSNSMRSWSASPAKTRKFQATRRNQMRNKYARLCRLDHNQEKRYSLTRIFLEPDSVFVLVFRSKVPRVVS